VACARAPIDGIAKAALAAPKVNTRRETEVVMLVSPCSRAGLIIRRVIEGQPSALTLS
jgi:hypothetical protein